MNFRNNYGLRAGTVAVQLKVYRRASLLCGLTAAFILASACGSPAAVSSPDKQQVAKLTEIVKSSAGQKEKADACRELARVANREAIAALAALLPDESLSHMARYALETIPDPEVDKALRGAAQKLHGRTLVGVIGSIGVRKDPKAVKLLAGLLRDTDPDVVQASARALGKIATPAAAKALQAAILGANPRNQLALCEGLFRCAERFDAAGRSKQAAAIYDYLRNSPAGHQVRTAALRGAILARHKDALPLLNEALSSPEYPVFAAAARTSLEMPGEAVTKLIAGKLPTASPDKQILLTQVLGKRGDAAALPALEAAARNCEQPVRLAAIRAVSELGNPASVGLLRELMGATDREIAQAAQEALAGLPGKEADAVVLAMLSSGDDANRTAALELVVRRRMTSAIPELYRAASGPDPRFRVNAVRRLAELADERQIPGILDLLSKATSTEDLDSLERALTSIALNSSDRQATARTVGTGLAERPVAQKCAVLQVLGAIGGPGALQSVRSSVSDSNPEVRATAIRVLGSWGSAETAPDLLQLARSAEDPKDKVLSLRSYLGMAGQTEIPAEQRLSMCRDAATLVQTAEEKKLFLAALGTIPSPESFSLIVPYLSDSAIREEAGVACLNVAGKLLEGKEAAKNAPTVLEAVQKVSEAAPDSELAKRAQSVAERAKSKAAAK